MIMVVVLVFQIQFANFYPENNRDRMMYVDSGTEVKPVMDGTGETCLLKQ